MNDDGDIPFKCSADEMVTYRALTATEVATAIRLLDDIPLEDITSFNNEQHAALYSPHGRHKEKTT